MNSMSYEVTLTVDWLIKLQFHTQNVGNQVNNSETRTNNSNLSKLSSTAVSPAVHSQAAELVPSMIVAVAVCE